MFAPLRDQLFPVITFIYAVLVLVGAVENSAPRRQLGFGSDTASAENQAPPEARSTLKMRRPNDVERRLAASAFHLRVIDTPGEVSEKSRFKSVGARILFRMRASFPFLHLVQTVHLFPET